MRVQRVLPAGGLESWTVIGPDLRPVDPVERYLAWLSRIQRLQDRASTTTAGVPARQRATEASLRQRLETLRAENQRLREENTGLKTQLAIAYGRRRASA